MKSIVLVSGGIDSMTLLYQLLKQDTKQIVPVHFNYGQKSYAQEDNAIEKSLSHFIHKHGWLGDKIQPMIKVDISNFKLFRSSLTEADMPVPSVQFAGATSEDTTNVPFRNIVFISMAVAYADKIGANEVFITVNATGTELVQTHWDSGYRVIGKVQQIVDEGTNRKIRLSTPFINLEKHEIFKKAAVLGLPFEYTWTCYNNRLQHCGICRACYERKKGFRDANLDDTTIYQE